MKIGVIEMMRGSMQGRLGFTITEVLVAVTIVGILASVAIGNYGTAVSRARWDTARATLNKIYQGERMYCSRALNDGGSEGEQYLVLGAAPCATAACRAGWRALGLENPNEPNGGTLDPGETSYQTTSPGGDKCDDPVTPLTVTATFRTGSGTTTQFVDQDFVFCGGGACPWVRP